MEEPNKASVSHDEVGIRCRSNEFSNQLPGLGKIVLLPVHSCSHLPFEQSVFAFDAPAIAGWPAVIFHDTMARNRHRE
jgi:hypothetical protein